MFILFLFFFNFSYAEEIWIVKFPKKHNHLPYIEKHFPYIDLIQHNYDQSSYIFLVPDRSTSNFNRYIKKLNGFYRTIITEHLHELNRKYQVRFKRSIVSDDPLNEYYYRNFLSYEEQQQWYKLLEKSPLTKHLVRLHTIGKTYENRSLTVIQISRNVHRRIGGRQQRQRPAIFIDAGMHAREWLSIGVANYLINQFLVLRESNRKVKDILRYFDLFVLPLMNPDGYEFSRNVNRLWRKNRSPTACSDFWNGMESCYGVDLNRNFPHQWNSLNGTSTLECSHSYRGPNPSSENEVESLIHFLLNNPSLNSKFHFYFNLHSYGRFWLLPWTYSKSEKLSHYDELFQRSSRVASSVMKNTYKVGQASFLLYPCSGTSIDFTATFIPHSMTFELSPIFDGLPMCYEKNTTVDHTCSVGFLSDPEVIEIDGKDIFNAIVEYVHLVVQSRLRLKKKI